MKIKTFVVAGMLAGTLLCPAAELELTGKTDREDALYPAGDTAFFAERIDPDAAFFVSTGLFDNSAHSSSVAAVFNSFRGKNGKLVIVQAGHRVAGKDQCRRTLFFENQHKNNRKVKKGGSCYENRKNKI